MRMSVVRAVTVVMTVIVAVILAMIVRVQGAGWRHLQIRNPVATIESNPLTGCES